MTYEYFDAQNIPQDWIKNRIDSEFRKHKDLDWSGLASKKIISQIMDWCYKNNTIPMKELRRFECVCGHSILEHGKITEDIDIENMKGKKCEHEFCNCPEFKQNTNIQNSKLNLMTTDGGWVNVLKLKEFLEGKE